MFHVSWKRACASNRGRNVCLNSKISTQAQHLIKRYTGSCRRLFVERKNGSLFNTTKKQIDCFSSKTAVTIPPIVTSFLLKARYTYPSSNREPNSVRSELAETTKESKPLSEKLPDYKRVLVTLNRFGPLMHLDPILLFKLAKIYRPYFTLIILAICIAICILTYFFNFDRMNFAGIDHKYWGGEYYRILTAPLFHIHYFHLFISSGILLTFGIAIEMAAGPLALAALIFIPGVVGVTTSFYTPENALEIYKDRIQTGLWPSLCAMVAFFWTGIYKRTPNYIINSSGKDKIHKIRSRLLIHALSKRKISAVCILFLGIFGKIPLVDNNLYSSVAGALTGVAMGMLWPKYPGLALSAGLSIAGLSVSLAHYPVWDLRFQCFNVAKAWERAEFLKAREWLRLVERELSQYNVHNNWTYIILALTEMACGHTSASMSSAKKARIDDLIFRDELLQFKEQSLFASEESKQLRNDRLTTRLRRLIDRVESIHQTELSNSAWVTMNDRNVYRLFELVFLPLEGRNLDLKEMQEKIASEYEGLFDVKK